MDSWNGYLCKNRNIGMLVFESLDPDTMDRSIQPINILNEETGFNNTVNSYMDHVWDGFYTGQLRLSRFPVQLETGEDYTVEMAGTPPKKMRYKLDADIGGVKLKVPYPVAGSYTVKANGRVVDYTEWDKEAGRHSALTKNKGCGENRYVGIENFLEFYITPDCDIEVVPRDAIMTKVRLEWTLDQFYADGGVTRFVDRLAASLGIHASRIKTVAVYEGSVIVDFIIDAEETEDQTTEQNLEVLMQSLVQGIESSSFDFGAPVLGLQTSEGQLLVGDPIPGPNGQVVDTDNQSSAIVGDTNLWDDLIIERDGEISSDNESTGADSDTSSNTETSEQSESKESPETTADESSEESTTTPSGLDNEQTGGSVSFTEDTTTPVSEIEETTEPASTTTSDEEQITKPRTEIVTVTIQDKQTITQEEEASTDLIIVIPIVVAIVLIVVAITFLLRCYQSKQKEVQKISENMQRVTANTDAGGYVDSQYVLRPDDEKNNIFARTSVMNHKVRQADNVTDTDGTDAFGESVSKFSSAAKMGDTLKVPTNNK